MKRIPEVCLIALSLAATTVAAQDPSIPMQRGVTVQMPATRNAVPVPSADEEDALVVAVTLRADAEGFPGALELALTGIGCNDINDKHPREETD